MFHSFNFLKVIILITMASFFLPASLCSQQENLIPGTQESIGRVLNEDGTVKPGIKGSFSTAGFEMGYGKNMQPVFRKQGQTGKTNSSVTWNSLGSGANGAGNQIKAAAVSPTGDIYIVGDFITVGDVAANYVAKWNGTSWSALTSGGSNGVNSSVTSLAVIGTDLYVGGAFTLLGDGTTSAKYIAKWNGSAWEQITDGIYNGTNDNVRALLVNSGEGKLYAGGGFLTAGPKAVFYVASLTDASNPLPVELVSFSSRTEGRSIILS